MENGLVFFSLFMILANGEDHRCNPISNPLVLVSTLNNWSHFATPSNQKTYPPNADCHWILKTSAPSRKIQLVVNFSSIEDRLFTDCDDFVEVFDGMDINYTVLISKWCGKENPMYITSVGSSLYVHFESDNFAEEAGVEFSFTEYAIPGCPPGWSDHPKSAACYRLIYSTMRNFTWLESQMHCNHEGANLVSFTDENEYEILKSIFSEYEVSPWIGISDATNEGVFENVDHSPLRWPNKMALRSQFAKHCVFINFDQNISQVDNCTARRPFLCKKRRDGSTVPCPPPEAAIRRGSILPLVTRWNPWLLWLLLLALLLICLLICVPCWMVYCKKRHRRKVDNGAAVALVVERGAAAENAATPKNVNMVHPMENVTQLVTVHTEEALRSSKSAGVGLAAGTVEDPVIAPLAEETAHRTGDGIGGLKDVTGSGVGTITAVEERVIEDTLQINSGNRVRPVTVHPVDVKVRSRVVGRFNRPQIHLLDNASSVSMDEFWREIG